MPSTEAREETAMADVDEFWASVLLPADRRHHVPQGRRGPRIALSNCESCEYEVVAAGASDDLDERT